MDGKSALQVELENGITSPQTGDVTTYAVVLMAIMSLAIVFVSKKVKA
jgi:LPXTG-motif cell wall-anchored protein